MGESLNRRAERWVCGRHLVEEFLAARPGDVRELWLDEERARAEGASTLAAARAAGISVRRVSRRQLEKISGGVAHQGMAALVRLEDAVDLNSFLRGLQGSAKKDAVIVALDQIQDPRNLGAISRCALNFGASAILVPERRASPMSQAALQASAGAAARIPFLRVGNLAQALKSCKDEGFWIYGAVAGAKSLWSAAINTPLVLVIGSEGAGLRPLVRDFCDETLGIPQAPAAVESLNASCAAAVLLYEFARRRIGGAAHP